MADIQALIDFGMSPEDAALLAADLQRYETAGFPQLSLGIGGLGPAAVDQGSSDFETFTAPLSNKGNPTATFGNITNTFGLAPDQQIRLVDDAGNVIYSGVGYDAANEVIKLAQGLTDAGGRKAAWEIQTTPSATQIMWGAASPQDGWKTIAQENKNQSVLGTIGDVVGTALPIAVSLIPGLQPFSPIVSGIAAGGAGAALRGDNILKGAAMGGLSAAGGEILGPALEGAGIGAKTATALGTGIGSTAGGLITGQGLENALLSGVASGGLSYFGGDIRNALGIKAPVSGGGGGGGDGGVAGDTIVVTGYGGTPISVPVTGGGKSAPQVQEGDILVTGTPSGSVGIGYLPSSSNINLNVPQSILDQAAQQTIEEPAPSDIIVTGQPQPAVVGIGGSTGGGTNPVTGEQNDITITADGQVLGLTPPILPNVGPFDVSTDINNTVKDVQVPTVEKPLTTADYIKAALAAAGLLGGGGGGDGATLGPDGTAISYNPLNRQQRLRTPAGAGLGSYGFDPFTYGQASGDQPGEYLFFEPTPVAAPVTPAFTVPSGALQFAEGGDVDDDMVKHLIEYRKGGGHNGPGKVKGIGSGQEDKIPAWLSDGEYVWSAQDVADLGDGSTDEGVRRLDKMRQMVRQQAGRKNVKKIAKPQKGVDALLSAVGGK